MNLKKYHIYMGSQEDLEDGPSYPWLPMSEAPKDGTAILGYDGEDMAVVYWRELFGEGEWTLLVCGAYCDMADWEPISWTPLPAKPEVK